MHFANTDNTYWNHNGKFELVGKKLRGLIPTSGECPHARSKNKALDKFRRASNCYYDLYNNGLCNRRAEFSRVFGFRGPRYDQYMTTAETERIEKAMDQIIIMAAAEQFLITEIA